MKLWGNAQVSESIPHDMHTLTDKPLNLQWPPEELVPGFKQTMLAYTQQVGKLGFEFASLLAEAFGLPPDTFDKFYDSPKELQQHRCKARIPEPKLAMSPMGMRR